MMKIIRSKIQRLCVVAAIAALAMALDAVSQADAPAPPAWPVVIRSSPEHGARDVDSSIEFIEIEFDRPMAEGMSWTGSGPLYPLVSSQASWGLKPGVEGRRICRLPVKLEAGRFYRVGVNATSFQNFESLDGMPAAHTAVWFTTKGAPESEAAFLERPRVVSATPALGAVDADPKLKEISMTFDQPMGRDFSWIGVGAMATGAPAWSEDRKTCALPVRLFPGEEYSVRLNSSHAVNFQSERGVPLDPVIWTFRTAGEKLTEEQLASQLEAASEAPKIARLDPPDEANNVDPARTTLTIEFDRPMGRRFSLIHFGKMPYLDKKEWLNDRTFRLTVELEPEREYQIWLNHAAHGQNFKSEDGAPLEPFEWTFMTGPAAPSPAP